MGTVCKPLLHLAKELDLEQATCQNDSSFKFLAQLPYYLQADTSVSTSDLNKREAILDYVYYSCAEHSPMYSLTKATLLPPLILLYVRAAAHYVLIVIFTRVKRFLIDSSTALTHLRRWFMHKLYRGYIRLSAQTRWKLKREVPLLYNN